MLARLVVAARAPVPACCVAGAPTMYPSTALAALPGAAGRGVSAPLTAVPPPAAGVRFASKKAGGSSKNGRESQSKRLGVKKFGGEVVIPGNIIVRQRGTKMHIERDGSVGMGRDHTIFARVEGHVTFRWSKARKRQVVSVTPSAPASVDAAAVAE